MLKKILPIVCSAFLFFSQASAQVEEAVIRWTPGVCTASCAAGIRTQLNKINGVSEISVNENQGQAVLKYNKGARFSLDQITLAMQMMGIWTEEIHLKVTGTVRQAGQDLFLASSGDGTQFLLLGQARPFPGQPPNVYVDQYNTANRALPDDVRKLLLDKATQKQEVIITGPIFQPERAPPLMLIVENIATQ